MNNIIDARGLSCPHPVLLAKKAILSGESGPIEILVDAEIAVENISRTASYYGWNVDITPNERDSLMRLTQK
ncbi:MAG: sulfurtransferase TusA family protein [Deltaproteobacteria bacterium]|jgi:TusA-related sulfurtransferase|nr:sulfurtransferase TusA family protein [Deltaproteobacteria bacterium]